jgi:hypothetical protein
LFVDVVEAVVAAVFWLFSGFPSFKDVVDVTLAGNDACNHAAAWLQNTNAHQQRLGDPSQQDSREGRTREARNKEQQQQ